MIAALSTAIGFIDKATPTSGEPTVLYDWQRKIIASRCHFKIYEKAHTVVWSFGRAARTVAYSYRVNGHNRTVYE